MTIRRLSGDCQDSDWTCDGMYAEDEYPEHAIAVGKLLDPSPVPLGPGEGAIRILRRVVRDAGID